MRHKMLTAGLCLLLGGSSFLGCTQTSNQPVVLNKTNNPKLTMRGPQGGYLMSYEWMDLSIEAVVREDGVIRVYGYDKEGKQADIIQYWPRNLNAVRLDYYPDGMVLVELDRDSDRGCLMAKIDMHRAWRINRAANVVVSLW